MGSSRRRNTPRMLTRTGLPPNDGIAKGDHIMRRVTVLLAAAATAMVGLVASAVPGTAVPAEEPVARPMHFGAVLVGGNEVPGPGDSDAWGLADVTVERGEVCWHVTVTGVTRPLSAGHIHAGPAGVSGPVVVPFEPVRRGCAEVAPRLTRFIKQHPGQFYVNLHNAEFPPGAVRGQLLP